jgi:hypothetical protein
MVMPNITMDAPPRTPRNTGDHRSLLPSSEPPLFLGVPEFVEGKGGGVDGFLLF